MKYSAAVVAAVLASGALAQPAFTNNVIMPLENQPFTLTFDGCAGGCTVTLQHGPDPLHLSDIRTLTTNAVSSFTVTLSDLNSGTYNFKISNNVDGSQPNYSSAFTYQSSSVFPSSSTSASATGSSSSSSSSASSASSSTSSSTSSSATQSTSSGSTTSSASSGSTTSAASTSASSSVSSKPSSTTSAKSTATTPPSAGSIASLSPLGLFAAAAAALFL